MDRKGFTFIELIVVVLIGMITVSAIRSCNKPKKQNTGEFVGLQTQALNAATQEVVEVEPETESEPEPTSEFRIMGHTIVSCKTATQEACGINLKGCTNGKDYYCVHNVEASLE